MNIEKIRNLTDAELARQERDIGEQLFKLKFQLKMGQTESLNKIRTLRKDVARIKTVAREKQIALGSGSAAAASVEIAGVVQAEEDKAVSAKDGAKGSAKNAAARTKAAAKKTTQSKQEKK